jgi:ElaB/YqjD/DUF883 family membrane-anchored ribosome-binding protein
MAYSEDPVTPRGTDLNEDRGPSSKQIRDDIDRTRREMDRNLDALEQKLTPSQLASEAWGLFRGGSSAGANRLWQLAKEHPAPAAVIGVGLGWMLVERSRGNTANEYRNSGYRGSYGYRGGSTGWAGYDADRGYGYDRELGYDRDLGESEGRLGSAVHTAKDKVSDLAGSAKDAVAGAADTASEALSGAREKVGETATHLRERASDLSDRAREGASELGDKARYQARQAQVGFWQTMEQNPLVIGAAALALGVIAGLAVPSTSKENELMGETRDRLLDRAKELGGEALERGKEVASATVDTLKQEAERQDLTPSALAEKVRTVAQEAKNKVEDEAKKQAADLTGKPVEQLEPELSHR